MRVTPDGQAGSTPTGLTVDEHVPQEAGLNATGLAESGVKGLSVTLPEGVALNPAAADGLLACSEEAIALQSRQTPTCPEASKVATVKIKTPLLNEPLEGAAYLAAQDANPFGSLVALYVYAEDPISGVRAKAAGEVFENPATGQLTAHFEGDPVFEHDPRYAAEPEAQFLPELPYEDIELHFFGGDRAPLTTPALCGTYTTDGTFTPWSENRDHRILLAVRRHLRPQRLAVRKSAAVLAIVDGGHDQHPGGRVQPIHDDDEPRRRQPEPELDPAEDAARAARGRSRRVKLCGEAQANAGTCGPESLIGHTIVSVGVGGDPYTVTGGKVFITGPYKGAPYGLSIVNPAKAGPFDLGKVIVRAKIEIDESTAALTITTDEKRPLQDPDDHRRHPAADPARQRQHRPARVHVQPDQLQSARDHRESHKQRRCSLALAVPFQATNCAVLAFKPKLTASTAGRTSRCQRREPDGQTRLSGGALRREHRPGQSRTAQAAPSRLTTLQKACTAAVFEANPAGCPAASVIGHATATTPVLPVPLTGPHTSSRTATKRSRA